MTARSHHGSEGKHRRRPSTAHAPARLSEWPLPSADHLAAFPAAIGTFVGRDQLLVELAGMIATYPVVTLTGPPGVGKTSLARHLAGHLSASEQVYLVDVEAVVDPDRLPDAIADQLGGQREAGQHSLERMVARLGDSGAILVLDNCEQVVAACADVVEQVLRRCAGLRVLATSREALGMVGEAVVSVPPLSVPEPAEPAEEAFLERCLGSEAVQLFCLRASEAQRGFEPTPDALPAIAEICCRLDGLPLAIELAAARTAVLSLPEIVIALDDHHELLASPGRGVGLRHSSLRAALDWSYELLSVSEQVLLRRLSVFRGGCTLDAAEEVCAGGEIHVDDVLDLLDALVAKSLVVADTACRPARYRLLESVRRYSYGRLAQAGETTVLAARHARWCIEFLDEVARNAGPIREWLERLDGDAANLSEALQWAVAEGRVRTTVALIGRVVPLWCGRGMYRQAQAWLERALRVRGRTPRPVRTKLLWDLAHCSIMVGDSAIARPHLEEALALATAAGDVNGRSEALRLLGFVLAFEGDPVRGLELIDEAVTLSRAAGEPVALANSLVTRARTHLFQGRARLGRRDIEEAMAVADGVDPGAVVSARVGMGWAALCLGDLTDAKLQLETVLGWARHMDDRHATALALAWLGELARLQGDAGGARSRFEDCTVLAQELGTPYPRARALLGLGRVAQTKGDASVAGHYFEDALSLARSASMAHLVAPCLTGLGEVAQVQGDLGRAHRLFDEGLAAARRCADLAAEAQALAALARLGRAEGDLVRSACLHHEALALRAEIDDAIGIADSLDALAGLATAKSTFDVAARLFAAAQSVRDACGGASRSPHHSDLESDRARARSTLGDEAFDSAWDQGAAFSTAEAVAYASRRRGRQARASLGWDALTAAERQVVDLVADGLTNPEIAQRLCVSSRTVQTHLRHVFVKVGVTSRTALVAEVVRRDA